MIKLYKNENKKKSTSFVPGGVSGKSAPDFYSVYLKIILKKHMVFYVFASLKSKKTYLILIKS